VRRVISLLVLLIATWQIVGFFSYIEWEKFRIRKEIKQVIKKSVPEENLVQLDFTFSEFKNIKWVESNEFKLNGRMYDVVSKKKTKTGYQLMCINDIQETVLFAKLDDSTANNLVSHSPLKHWFKVLKMPFLVINEKQIVLVNHSITERKVLFKYNIIFSDYHLYIDSPPPQV
jgi:hypothetical protein